MKTTDKFYSSLGLLVILNIIIKPLWIFAIDRQVQNTVGTEAYGAYFSLLNLSVIGSFLLDWGITTLLNKQLAGGKNEFRGLTVSFLFTKLLFAGVYTIVLFTIAWLSGITRWDILCLVIVIQVLSSLFIFLRNIVTAMQWFRTDAWLSVLDKSLMILLCGSFLWFPAVTGTISIDVFLLLQAACIFVAVITVIVILNKKKFRFRQPENILPSKNVFTSAMPYAFIVLLMSLHYRLDGFLLERMRDEYEAGIYAAAYRLLDAANMVGYLAASFLLPYIARQWGSNKEITLVVLTVRHFLMIFSFTTSVIFFFLAGWFQNMLYHNTDSAAIDVLKWCLPALIGYSLVQVYGTVLTATGHITAFCYIVLASVIINAVLNLVLIPEWGARGSCFAAIISQFFCGITALIFSYKKCNTPVHFRSMLLYIFIGAIVTGFLYWSGKNGLHEIIQISIAVLFSLIIVFFSGLFKISRLTGSINRTL